MPTKLQNYLGNIINNLIYPIVSALTYSLIPDIFGRNKAKYSFEINQITYLIQRRLYQMPQYLAVLLMILTLIFDWLGIVTNGKRFHRQQSEQRQKQIRRWKNSNFEFCQDFIRFYETLITFASFSSKAIHTHY